MNGAREGVSSSKYDRSLLLSGARRNEILELWEVQQYGIDSYYDADYVSIYDMRPSEWYAKGVRLLGRTAVECTRDKLAQAIGKDVAATAARGPSNAGVLVIDPFAGSANTLYWLLRDLPGARGRGFELDVTVSGLTRHNLEVLGVAIAIVNTDYQSGLVETSVVKDELLIAFIAPPWGDALDKVAGLNLSLTSPPVTEIVDLLVRRFPQNPLLGAVQVYETVDARSLVELKGRFDWSELRVYSLNAAGENHGVMIGT